VLALAAGIVVARLLSVEAFAIYALALAFRGTVQFLADLGTGAASARSFAQFEARGAPAEAWRLYGRLLGVRVAIAALLVAAAVIFHAAASSLLGLRADEDLLLALFLVIGVGEMLAGLAYYVLVGTIRQPVVNRIAVGQGILQPALVITAAAAGLGLEGVLAALAVTAAGRAILLHVFAARALRGIEAGHAVELEGGFARTAVAASAGKVSAWVHSRGALSFPLVAANPRAAFAVFALAYDLVHQLLSLLSSPTGGVLGSVMAKNVEDRAWARRTGGAAVRGLALAGLGLALAFAAASAAVGEVLYGGSFAEIDRYVVVLAPAVALEIALSIPATSILLAANATLRGYRRLRVATALLAIVYLLVGFDHLLAVVVVLAIVRVGGAVACLVLAQRAVGTLVPAGWWVRLGVVSAVAAAAGATVTAVDPPSIAQLVLAPLATAVLFMAGVRAARLVAADEAAYVSRLGALPGRAARLLRG
jgi:O-antigen/teichoic acid export membrane protein